jgi:hypothetical protein
MALIDVSEVLMDPDFMDSMTCTRYMQTVPATGMAVNTSTTSIFYGVVTSGSGDILDRIATGERVKGSIVIHTTFRLRDGSGASQTADMITWKGSNYIVSTINDYSHFGRGFVSALCDLKPLAG